MVFLKQISFFTGISLDSGKHIEQKATNDVY